MENFALDIKILSDLIEKKANSALSKYHITLSQARVLICLAQHKRQISLKELEKIFNVSQATMQGVISRMEKKGYLCTVYLPANRKQKLVVLTEYGNELALSMLNSIRTVNENLVSSLTKQEQINFTIMLDKIRTSLE